MYHRILLATDLSEGSLHAAETVRLVAAADATLRVIHVAPRPAMADDVPPHEREALERYARERDETLRLQVRGWCEKVGLHAADIIVRHGSVAREVAAEAESSRADLVAVGSHGLSRFERVLLGSQARAVLRHARGCDVLVARGHPPAKLARVVVATDFFGASRAAGDRALDVSPPDAELYAFHAIDPDMWSAALEAPKGQDEWLRKNLKDMLRTFNESRLAGRATETLRPGRPAFETVAFAREKSADLVVVGTHGPGRVERALIGSVAEAIVERAACAVLVVRG